MEYDVRRYLTVRSAYGASWTHDGEQLAFLFDASGESQAWTVDAPQSWPTQWTTGEERVTFVDCSPARDELVFGRDRGGNERSQLHLLDLETGEIDDLTRAPGAKHRWGGWADDGDRFAFASNRRDESVFDVYVQDRTERGDDAELVAEGDGWLSVVGWAPDDERLLVHEARSNVDQDLHVCDLETGALEPVTDHAGEVRYSSPEWAPDGDGVYVATDLGADTRYLARLDLASGEVESVHGDATGGADGDVTGAPDAARDPWSVVGIRIHEDTGRIVYGHNVEGFSELTVGRLDGDGGIADERALDLPEGVSGGWDLDPDGERLALSVSGRQRNANVWVVPLEDGEAAEPERWTDAPTAGIPPETFREPELVHFESTGAVAEGGEPARDAEEVSLVTEGALEAERAAQADATDAVAPTDLAERFASQSGGETTVERPDALEIPALFTLPADAEPGETPVIVDVHGGPESQRRPSFRASAQFFLAQGYAVLEPNVRGSSGYGRAYGALDDVERRVDSVADLRAAHDWLTEHEAVDPDRIAVRGGSYGGFMTLAALVRYPELWAAGIDVVGIASFVTFLENTGSWRRALREAEYGSLEADRELLERVSPLTHADRISAPLFVAHGANDPRVPVEEAEQIAEAAREQGVPVELLVFDDEGHGFSSLENRIEAYRTYAEFLEEHV